MERIGPYVVLEQLARGGQGAVYKARDEGGGLLAIKLLAAQRAADPQARKRFEVEVETLRRISHSNVIPILDAGVQQGAPWLALEFVDGESLEARLRRGPLPVDEAQRVISALARGLNHVHAQGVLHRDLKPDNVLLSGERVLLTDFGIARDEAGDATRLTQEGMFIGTPGYWAPEQARGERSLIGKRTDVYGLGAVLYACLVGRPPVQGKSLQEYLESVRFKSTPSPRRVRAEVPGWLSGLCMRCLAALPSQRPTVAEVIEVLEAGPGDDGEQGPRGRWLPIGLAGCTVVLALAAAWIGSRGEAHAMPDAGPPAEQAAPVERKPRVPPAAFKLPGTLGAPARGAFAGEVLVTGSAGLLQIWDGRSLTPSGAEILPAAPGRGIVPTAVLGLKPGWVVFGGDRTGLNQWQDGAVTPLGEVPLHVLARGGPWLAYGLRTGELGVYRIGDSLERRGAVSLGGERKLQIQGVAWLSPTRLVALTRWRAGSSRKLAPTQVAEREGQGEVHLLACDADGELRRLHEVELPGNNCVVAQGDTVLVGTSGGHLFRWRVEHDRLVAAGRSYREVGALLSCRDLVFVDEHTALGAFAVRRVEAVGDRWDHLNGVAVYDLKASTVRVLKLNRVRPLDLAFDQVGEQLVVLGETGAVDVLPLERILDDAVLVR